MDISELISKYPKIFVAVLSPILLVAGYFYRARQDKKKNQKVALYILMEIWHRMSIFHRRDFDDVFDRIITEIKRQFPGENITEGDIESSKAHFTPILIKTAHKAALSDIVGYQEKYQEAVSLISSDDPIFAYKVSSAGNTKRFLSFLDAYLNMVLKPVEDEGHLGMTLSSTFKTHMSAHAGLDSIKDLESDIRKLSWKIGIFTFISCLFTIRKRRKTLRNLGSKEVENMVANVLAPAMREFNKKMQPTADGVG